MHDESIRGEDLARRQCVPCKGGVPPLAAERVQSLRRQVSPDWTLVGGHHLQREFKVKDFRQALALANRFGEIAESQRHHPDLLVSWGKLRVTLFTHAIDGLHENDFIIAARIDALLRSEHPGDSD
ncbi:MAG: 4a-hydroxytetrahydrobiopterin dehydratase [Spirochaetia bacterium]